MKGWAIGLAMMAACAGCGQQERPGANDMAAMNEPVAEAEPVAANEARPGEAGGLPDDRNLVEEGPIDPKSAQGAGLVLQNYSALLEQGRFAEARRLWSDGGNASGKSEAAFAESFANYAEVHAEIGAPGMAEGAAGSVYVEIPVRFYGKRKSGGSFSSAGTATLRRVNDVPGSTAEQREWRINRLDVQPPL